MVLEKTLETWTARRSNQSILRKSLEKTLMLGKVEGRKRRGQEDEVVEWLHQLSGREFEQIQEIMKDREAWQAAVRGVVKRWTRFSD